MNLQDMQKYLEMVSDELRMLNCNGELCVKVPCQTIATDYP